MNNNLKIKKSDQAFRTISEAATLLDLPQHVLRFWETKFPQLRPMKRGGGRRYYRPDDVVLLERIKGLLHNDGYTIKGVQKLLREGHATEPAQKATAPEPAAMVPKPASETENAASDEALTGSVREEMLSVLDELREIRAMLDNPSA